MEPVTDDLTASQRRAVESDAVDLCVTAGAGSGKTRVLVHRFIHLVLVKKVPVDRILAITFTEKAAQEMKERIAEAFEKAGREEERRAVEFAYISTIDSFCARLLRENALEAGVDPRFRVLEDFEAEGLLEEVTDQVLLARGEAEMRELVEITGIADLRGVVIDLYGRVRHSGLPLEPATLEPPATTPSALAAIRERLAELRKLESDLTPDQWGKIAEHLGLADELEAVPASATPGELAAACAQAKGLIHLGRVRHPGVKAALQPVKEELLDGWLGERLEPHARPLRARLGDLLGEVHEAFEAGKRSQSALDFADLEWNARRLLAEAPLAAAKLRRRFPHIFLDEFQDTNPLQQAIVDSLREGGALFATGDAKQSIYGFRDADVGVIARFRERTEATGGHVRLAENFRSRPEIVAFANRLFDSSLWPAGPVPFEAMEAAAEHDGKSIPSVELLRVEGENSENARRAEAQGIASRIEALVGDDRCRITRRRDEHPGRRLSYGDIAILFRSTTPMRIYERELAGRQIPYFVQKGRGYFQTQEVRDLVNLIRILDNPGDDFALAAVLRSPLVGLDDDDLYRLAGMAPPGRGRLSTQLRAGADRLSPEGRERLERFRSRLERIRRRRGLGPLWVALEEILARTEIAAGALLHFNGRRRFANLQKLVDLVRSAEGRGETSLIELARLLEEYQGKEVRESEAAIESPRDDTVKMMTLHAAKGLEFPVVVLADLGREIRRSGGDSRRGGGAEIFRRGGGLGLALYDPADRKRSLRPASTLVLQREQEQAEAAEEVRLLYVGVTRAKEHLILSAWKAPSTAKRSTWVRAIVEGLGGEESLGSMSDVAFPSDAADSARREGMTCLRFEARREIEAGAPLPASLVAPAAAELAAAIEKRVALPAPPADTTPYLVTATAVVQHHVCPRRYDLRYRVGAPTPEFPLRGDLFDPEAGEARDDELPAAVLGDRVHRILAEPEGSPTVAGLLADLPAAEQKEAIRQVETFRRSELGRLAAAGEAWREVPFALLREGATLRGQIDLILTRPDGDLILVDYKTSRATPAEVGEKALDFELQLRLYALAMRDLFGRLPARAALFFLDPGVVHDVDLSSEALSGAERAIAGFFAAHREAAFPQNPARRHCFPCGYRTAYCPNLRFDTPSGEG